MIELNGVSFTYEGRAEASLRDVSLRVAQGECVLVTGPSGCGKSTLLRLLNGLAPHYFPGTMEGEVRVGGVVPGDVPLYAQAELTGSVFQNPRTQFYTTDTTSELAFVLENRGLAACDIVERVERTANDMRLAPLMDRSLFELSGGEKQKIACACVQVGGADIVLLDEPTANLDYDTTLMLADVVRMWKRSGKTVLIAEHRIAWILDALDRLVVMDDGRLACEFAGEALDTLDEATCRRYGLRSPRLVAPEEAGVPAFVPPGDGTGDDDAGGGRGCHASQTDACAIENLHFSYVRGRPVLDFDRIDLAIGKVTAVVGRNGRGKTTFLRCLAGLAKKDASVLRYKGQAWGRKERLRNVFLIKQDVNCQLFTQSVREEVEISLPAGTPPEMVAARVDEVLASLDLADVAERDPFTLSGGQKQRVAVACAVASGREVIAFDEPTSGLGFGHMMQFAALLGQLRAQGRTVVVVTHDAELIETVADYLLVL